MNNRKKCNDRGKEGKKRDKEEWRGKVKEVEAERKEEIPISYIRSK